MDPRFRLDPDDQVLSLDQIRSIRSHNNYVERPLPAAFDPGPQTGFWYAHEDRVHPVRGPPTSAALPRSQSQQQSSHLTHLSRSSTVSSTFSRSSATSDQRLLSLTPSHTVIVCTQPKTDLKPDDFHFGKSLPTTEDNYGQHMFICERCARCKCQECCSPRRLPSCMACNQRCLCSPENLVEHATCLCCIKGLFYHCSAKEDDEENCADRPCSCSSAHTCSRWAAMTVLSFCLPCLCCYPPARLCLAMCRCVHDRATRPGCRCANTNTVCRKISASNPGPVPLRSKTMDKLL